MLSGLSKLGRAFRSHDGCLIFYGHRVADDDEGYMQGLSPTWLDDQLAYIARHYEVISLRQLVDCLVRDRTPPRKSAVITFDDGFRDNYEVAFPLFQKYGVSASIFVVTGSLTHGQLPWSQRLGYMFQNTPVSSLSCIETADDAMFLRSSQERTEAYKYVKRPISKMCREEREKAIERIAGLLQVEPPMNRMMTWDHAREMLAGGVEIGAHTYSHPLLAEISFEEAKWEMQKSLFDVKEKLSVENPAFCFPAGSCNENLINLVPKLGFSSVFVPNQAIRLNLPGAVTPFSLSRRGLPNAPALYLEAEIEGPFDAIRATLGRYQ